MPSSASPPGICPPLLLDYPHPLIVGIIDYEQLHLLIQGPRSLGRILSVPLGIPQHLSTFRVVLHCPCNPIRASLPYSPEGVG